MALLADARRLLERWVGPRESLRFCPFVVGFDLHSHAFEIWIADREGLEWYGRPDDWQGAAEPRELLALVAPGERVLELGCHHGVYSILLAKAVGEGGLVLGVEANPYSAMVAQAQVTLNRLGNVCRIMHAAICDVPGKLAISGDSCSVVVESSQSPVVEAPAVTGDQLLDEYGPFHLVKIDIEGYEGRALRGCRRLLASRPKIALEVHRSMLGRYGTTVEEIFDLLDIDRYEGVAMRRDFVTTLPFEPYNLPEDDTLNLFLRPKQGGGGPRWPRAGNLNT